MKLKLPCPYRTNVELAPFTTFRMGGHAALLAEPRNREEFVGAIRMLREEGLTYRILGGGANVFIDDRGLDDVIILSTGFTFVMREAEDTRLLRVSAGLSTAQFVSNMRQMRRTGAECLVGIPGTMGGATVMNAGGRHGQMADVTRRVRVLLPSGEEDEIAVTANTFRYRGSIFGDDLIVVETVVELAEGDRDRSARLIREYLSEKGAAQPLTARTAGCVFKNPAQESAGRLLDRAGVKGAKVGGAEVSTKHANFIVNSGGATLEDVTALIARMREAVLDSSGVELETEVKLWAR